MEKFENFNTEIIDKILIVKIGDKEGSKNVNSKFLKEIKTLIQNVYDQDDIIGVLITGKGEEIFANGLGMEELDTLDEINGRKFSEEGQEALEIIENCPKPIIAAVNGIAQGTAVELILACHIRLATEKANFRMPSVRLGLIPCFGGTQRLPQIVGKAKALEILLTGSSISYKEANEIGLVNHVVNYKDSMIKKGMEIIKKIMRNSSLSVNMIIDCVNASYHPEENGYQLEANSFENCCKTDFFKQKLNKQKDENNNETVY